MAMGVSVQNTYGTETDAGTLVPKAVGMREDLTDIFSRIDPAEVPFYSNTPKATQKGTLHEWQVQELAAVAKTAQPEGFETTFEEAIPSVRMGNRAQILAGSYIVSGTLDVVDKAGRDRETVLQRTLKGLELRRNVEAKLLDNVPQSTIAPVAGAGGEPRTLAGLVTWITNGFWGTGAASAPTGDGSDAATIAMNATGQVDVLTFDRIDTMLELAYNQGGKPSMLLMTPNAKRNFSHLNDGGTLLPAQNRFNKNEIADTAFIGSVGVYLSDYGRLDTMIDRFAPGDSVLGGGSADGEGPESIFAIDKRHVQIATLPGRSFLNQPLAKTGDADKAHLLWEGTLRVSAPKAHGYLAVDNTERAV